MVEELVRVWPHSRLGRALLLSAIIHAGAAVYFPSLRFDAPEPEPLPILQVQLVRTSPAAPRPSAEPQPETAPAEAPRAKPPPEKPRSRPTPVIASAEPVRTREARAVALLPAPPAAPEPALAAAPAVPEPPAPPAPADKPAVAEATPRDVLFGFGRLLEQALESNQQYPRLARQRGWQGVVKMRVQFLPGGQIGQVSIVRSSGFAMLDETAIAMLRTAELPPIPDGLRRREFLLDVPVEFRLKS
jgi:protein TonB